MTITAAQVLTLIEQNRIQGNPKYDGKYFQMSGDCSQLDYRANYCSNDLTVYRFTGRDWDGYEKNKEYLSNWYAIDFDDLLCRFKQYGECSDIELETEYETV